jgi:hypothetical protein
MDWDMLEQCVIDSLLRFKGSVMRSATFELLATIAAFKQGKKYLLQNHELVGCL